MNMLDRFLGHDAAASRALFVLSLGLSDEQLDRATLARRVQAEGRLDDTFVDPREQNPRTRTLGAAIGHVITHSATHRGHITAMLERPGVPAVPEGDMLGWERE